MVNRKTLLVSMLALVPVAFCARGAEAQTAYIFRKIADTSTAIPNGTGNFDFSAGSIPSIDGNIVAFYGDGTGPNALGTPVIQGQVGLYARDISNINNPLVRLVDSNMDYPGAGPITTPGFVGRENIGGFTGPAVGLTQPVLAGGKVGFAASGLDDVTTGPGTTFHFLHGAFTVNADGSNLTKVAESSDTPYWAPQISSNGHVAFDFREDVAPPGSDTIQVRDPGGILHTVVSAGDLIPGGFGTQFAQLDLHSVDDAGTVTFFERSIFGQPNAAFQADINGNITAVAAPPAGFDPAIELADIIKVGGTIDGKTVEQLQIGRQFESGGRVAFSAVFDDELVGPVTVGYQFSRGVFVAEALNASTISADALADTSGLTVADGTFNLTGSALAAGTSINVGSTAMLNLADASSSQFNLQGNLVANGDVIGNITVMSGGVFSGSSYLAGTLIVENGGILDPGNSPGIQSVVGDVTLAGGGVFNFQLYDASLDPNLNPLNPGWDLLTIEGRLLATATAENPFIINIEGLLGISPNDQLGKPLNFDQTVPSSYTFMTWSGKSGTPDLDVFEVNIVNPVAFGYGTFAVTTGKDSRLLLEFTPGPAQGTVPEPSTFVLFGSFGLLLMGRRLQCRQKRD